MKERGTAKIGIQFSRAQPLMVLPETGCTDPPSRNEFLHRRFLHSRPRTSGPRGTQSKLPKEREWRQYCSGMVERSTSQLTATWVHQGKDTTHGPPSCRFQSDQNCTIMGGTLRRSATGKNHRFFFRVAKTLWAFGENARRRMLLSRCERQQPAPRGLWTERSVVSHEPTDDIPKPGCFVCARDPPVPGLLPWVP